MAERRPIVERNLEFSCDGGSIYIIKNTNKVKKPDSVIHKPPIIKCLFHFITPPSV
tara:strand:- start:423 stop:590 length:168 start_codon:yes stop_codon:yes gene_type:complete